MTKSEARNVAHAIRRFLNNRRLEVNRHMHMPHTSHYGQYDRFVVEGTVPLERKDECWNYIASKHQMPDWYPTSDIFDKDIKAARFRVQIPYVS